MRENSESDAASSSQARLQDAHLGGLTDTATVKPVATKDESGDVDLSEPETWSSREEAVLVKLTAWKKATGWNPMHPVNQTNREVQKLKEKNGHTIYTSGDLRTRTWQPMDDMDVDMAIWGTFLNATRRRAAVHLGQDYEASLRYVIKHLWNSVGQSFNEN